MHLADAFIQSDLQCIQAIHFLSVCVVPKKLNPQHFVLLTQCSTTEPQEHAYSSFTQWQLIFHNLVNLPNTSFLFKILFSRNPTGSFSFEWMNEWCIYIALYSVLLYTQCALQSCGGEGHSSTTTSAVQHPLGWCDGCHRTTAPVHSLHTSYRCVTPGLHAYSLWEVPWDF